jgi:hypothetical protein
VISNSHPANLSVGSTQVTGVRISASQNVAYIAAEPGTWPGFITATIRNVTLNGTALTVRIADGGFDPVAIEAKENDEIDLTVMSAEGTSRSFTVRVPPRRPPRVVRTNPDKGRIDVALNVQIEIVFSEPIDKSTINGASVTLTREGAPVNASLTVSDNGLEVRVTPLSSLAPLTTYQLVVSRSAKDLDGEALEQDVVTGFTTEGNPESSSRTEKILYVDVAGHILTVNADGSDSAFVTSGIWPSWAPDGRSFVYSTSECHDTGLSNEDGPISACTFNLDIHDIETGRDRRLVSNFSPANSDGYVEYPSKAAWSPAGNSIAFETIGGSLYVSSTEGALRKLNPNSVTGREPAWSPDGKQIAFICASISAGFYNICVIGQDGSGLHFLTADNNYRVKPAWSPDGQFIAFEMPANGYRNVAVMPAAGGEPMILGFGWHPSWSRDGSKIVFGRGDGIYTMTRFGTDIQRVITAEQPVTPAWRP